MKISVKVDACLYRYTRYIEFHREGLELEKQGKHEEAESWFNNARYEYTQFKIFKTNTQVAAMKRWIENDKASKIA